MFSLYKQNFIDCIESEGIKLSPSQDAYFTLKFLNLVGAVRAESHGRISELKKENAQLRTMIRKAKKCLIHEM